MMILKVEATIKGNIIHSDKSGRAFSLKSLKESIQDFNEHCPVGGELRGCPYTIKRMWVNEDGVNAEVVGLDSDWDYKLEPVMMSLPTNPEIITEIVDVSVVLKRR